MRMDPRQELTAEVIVNTWSEQQLAQMLRELGEERYAGGISRQIVARRPPTSTSDLVEAIKAGMPPRPVSVPAIRPAAASRRFGSRSTVDRSSRCGPADRLGQPRDWRSHGCHLVPPRSKTAGSNASSTICDRLHLPAGAAGLRLRA